MGPSLPPTPPIVPPIRTMADDLAAAERGELGDAEPPVSASPMLGVSEGPGSRVQPVALPLTSREGPVRRRAVRVISAVIAAALVGAGVWGVLTFVPKTSGTVADAVPADAVAFVSIRLGQREMEPLGSLLLAHFEGLTLERLQGATDLTYVLLPGSSPAEPVAALLVRGLPAVDLSASPGLSPHPAPAGGVLIVETSQRGRLAGSTGRVWGNEAEFRKLFHGVPPDAPILLALRGSALGSLLQPLAPHPVATDAAVVLGFAPIEGTAAARVHGGTSAAHAPPVADSGVEAALKALPDGVVLAGARPSFSSDVTALPTSGRLPSSLASVLQVFGTENEAARSLTDAVTGPWVFGVLATETPGVLDAVAVIPLKAGADPRASLRTLESEFVRFGPYLAGSNLPDAAFAEAAVRGIPVRYVNFGSSARAFDYAVGPACIACGEAAAGRPEVLLLATSRASMAALIAAMHGEEALAGSPSFAAVSDAANGADWLYVAPGEGTRAEVPPALAVLYDVVPAMVVGPAGPRRLAGLAMLAGAPPLPAEGETPEASPTPGESPVGGDEGAP